ncbi:MAG: coenzyme F420 hydrogenase subunit beta [Promethearchaeota archaeon]|nr:MAG: coenzyme F420 hydrogenase subunit beta [Candidatus Lokiarchaeota archaeon]
MGDFGDLEKEIIEPGICTHCGACLSVCPDYNIEWGDDDRPHRDEAKGMCENCSECYDGCHSVQGHFNEDEMDKFVFKESRNKEDKIGIYKQIVSAQSTDKKILQNSQDGGIVSAIAAYLFDNNKVDGIISTGRGLENNSWKPEPEVAVSMEEFLATSGTKYYIAPILKMLKVGVIDKMLDRLAVVGLPCQIRSSRFLEKIKFDLAPAIFYTIGLFCTQNYKYNDLKDAIEQKGLDISNVDKMYIDKGFYHVVSDNKEIKIALKDMKDWVLSFCQYCNDYSAEYADISIGNQGSETGWSTIVIRTDKGEKLFNGLKDDGYIKTKEIEKPELIFSNSEIKRKNSKTPFN